MRRRVAAAATLLGVGYAAGDYSTTPDPTAQFGTWEGWGVSLCWWANVMGQRDDLADAIFTLKDVTMGSLGTVPGLGFNIARYNAGGSAWRAIGGEAMAVSPNIPRFKQIEGFWQDWNSDDPGSASWNWSVDANQRAMLQKAHARGADQLELFSNSPMWWMLTNHNPSGANSGSNDNLQTWNYGNHSKYMATVAAYAKEHWGITFRSVEIFNEPMGNWWKASGTQEGCHFKESTQGALVPHIRSELDKRSLTTMMVSASDENTYDQARSTWNSFSSAAQGMVGRVNVHGYQEGGGRRDLLYTDVHGKAALWNSEYGDGNGDGMNMASNLNLDFVWLHPTAWVYWQALDESGGWGLMRFNPDQASVEAVNTKWFVLAQFSRHIRPGMTIVDGGDGSTVAAYDAAARRLVLVTTNSGGAQSVTYDLSKFAAVAGPVTRWSTATTGTDRHAEYHDVTLAGKGFTAPISASTVQTFQVDGVDV